MEHDLRSHFLEVHFHFLFLFLQGCDPLIQPSSVLRARFFRLHHLHVGGMFLRLVIALFKPFLLWGIVFPQTKMTSSLDPFLHMTSVLFSPFWRKTLTVPSI